MSKYYHFESTAVKWLKVKGNRSKEEKRKRESGESKKKEAIEQPVSIQF